MTSFAGKVNVIKENYFGKETVKEEIKPSILAEETIQEEKVVPAEMQKYVKTLSNLLR